MRLSFDILARDQASRVFNQVGRAAQNVSDKIRQLDRQKAVPTVTLNTAPAQAAAAAISRDLAKLQAKQITLPVNLERIDAQVAALQAQLARLRAERVNVAADLRGGIDAQIKVVNAELRKLAGQKVRIPVEMGRVDAAVASLQANLSRIGPVNVPVAVDQRSANASLSRFRAQLSRLKGEDITVRINADTNLAQRIITSFASAAVLDVGVVATAVTTLGAALVGIGTAAAPAAAAGIAGLGSAAIAGGQGFATYQFAMHGVNRAYQAMETAQDSQRAGYKLTDAEIKKIAKTYGLQSQAGTDLVRSMLGMSSAMDTVRGKVQEALFPQLTSSLDRLRSLLPTLQTGMLGTAGVLGTLAVRGAAMVTSGPWRADFATVMSANTRMLSSFGDAGLSGANILRNLIVAAAPLGERLAGFVQRAATAIDGLVQRARGSGALAAFFQSAGDTAAQLGRIVGNVGVALFGVARNGTTAGQTLLTSFEGVTRKFRELVLSAEGQNRIRAYFDQAVPVAQEMGRLVGAVGASLLRLSTIPGVEHLIHQVRVLLLPAVENLARVTAGHLGEALVRLLTRLVDILAAMLGNGGALLSFVNTMDKFAAIVQRVVQTPGVGEFVNRLIQIGGTALAISFVGTRIASIGVAIARVLGPAALFVRGLIAGATAGGGLVNTLGGIARTVLLTVGRFALFTPVGAIITGIATAFILAWRNSESFRAFLTSLGDVLRTRLMPALSALGGAVAAVFGGRFGEARAKLGEFVSGVGATVAGLAGRIGAGLLAAGRALVSWIVTAVPQAQAAVGQFMVRVVGAVLVGAPRLAAAAVGLGSALVGWVQRTIPPLLADLGRWIGAAAGWVTGTGLPRLRTAAAVLGGALLGWVTGIVPRLLTDLGGFIGRAVGWIVSTGVPTLARGVVRLGSALLGWVLPQAGRLLGDLAEFMGRAVAWIVGTGLPRLVIGTARLGAALLGWVLPKTGALIADLGTFLTRAVAWIATQGVPRLTTGTARLGAGLVGWVLPRIPGLIADVARLIGSVVTWVVTQGVPRLMSGFAELARRAITGFVDTFRRTDLGRAILPALAGILISVRQTWDNVRNATATAFAAVRNVVGPAWAAVRAAITGAISGITGAVSGAWNGVRNATATAFGALRGIAQGAWNGLVTVVKVAVTAVGTAAYLAWLGLKTTTSAAFNAIRDVTNRVWRALPEPVRTALRVIGDLAAATWFHLRNGVTNIFNNIVFIIRGAWNVIRTVTTAALDAVRSVVTAGWNAVRAITTSVFNNVRGFLGSTWAGIRALFDGAMRAVRGQFQAWWDTLRAIGTGAFNAIRTFIDNTWRTIRGIWDRAQAGVRGVWQAWWDTISGIGRRLFDGIRGNIDSAWRGIRVIWDRAQGGIRGVWDGFWNGIKSVGSTAINNVKTTVERVLGQIKGSFDTAKTNIGKSWDGLKSVVAGPIDFLRNQVYNGVLVPVWNRVAGLVNGPKLQAFSGGGIYTGPDPFSTGPGGGGGGRGGVWTGGVIGGDGAVMRSFATGGIPYGVRPGYTPGRDTHTIQVGGGEAIMRPEWTRAVGSKFVHGMNRVARRGVKATREAMSRMYVPEDSVRAVSAAAEYAQRDDDWTKRLQQDRRIYVYGNPPGWDVPGAIAAWNKVAGISLIAGRGPLLNQATVETANIPDADWFGITEGPQVALNTGKVMSAALRRAATIHEFGHMLGLNHSASPNSIMATSGIERMTGPQPNDVASLRSIFPPQSVADVPAQEGGVSGALRGIVSKVAGAASGVTGWVLGGLRKAAELAFGPIRALINSRLQGSGVADTFRGLSNKAIDLLLGRITQEDEGGFNVGSGSPYGGAVGTASGWGVRPHVAAVGKIVQRMFNLPGGIGGYRAGGGGDHPKGLALDLMTSPLGGGPRPEGNRLAAFGLANAAKFALSYIIWAGKIATASRGWRWAPYTRYGPLSQAGNTKFHNDHNHWSFRPSGYQGLTSSAAPTGTVRTGSTRAAHGGVVNMDGSTARLSRGGIVRARMGGVPALLAEGGRDEVVAPLPAGFEQGMKVIGAGGGARAEGPARLHPDDLRAVIRAIQSRPIHVTVEMDRRVVGRALANDADRLSRGG